MKFIYYLWLYGCVFGSLEANWVKSFLKISQAEHLSKKGMKIVGQSFGNKMSAQSKKVHFSFIVSENIHQKLAEELFRNSEDFIQYYQPYLKIPQNLEINLTTQDFKAYCGFAFDGQNLGSSIAFNPYHFGSGVLNHELGHSLSANALMGIYEKGGEGFTKSTKVPFVQGGEGNSIDEALADFLSAHFTGKASIGTESQLGLRDLSKLRGLIEEAKSEKHIFDKLELMKSKKMIMKEYLKREFHFTSMFFSRPLWILREKVKELRGDVELVNKSLEQIIVGMVKAYDYGYHQKGDEVFHMLNYFIKFLYVGIEEGRLMSGVTAVEKGKLMAVVNEVGREYFGVELQKLKVMYEKDFLEKSLTSNQLLYFDFIARKYYMESLNYSLEVIASIKNK